MRLTPSMSRGRRRGCSRASTRIVACPLWDSQSVVSQGMRAPFTSSQGALVRYPRRTSASSQLSIDLALLSLGPLVFFYCLAPFGGASSPSFKSSIGLFFLKSGTSFSLRSAGSAGGGGRLGITWVLGTSFEVCPLFLFAIKPLKPILYFKSMSSSSASELVSGRATINLG